MNILAGLFDLSHLYNEDADNEYVFAIGHHDIEEISRRALDLVQTDWDDQAEDNEWFDPCRFEVVGAGHGTYFNDRSMAKLEGCSSYIVEDDLIKHDSDWEQCEENIAELWVSRDEDHPRWGDLADDWPERVLADPDRYPLAPIGPFPGTMVILEGTYPDDEDEKPALEAVRS